MSDPDRVRDGVGSLLYQDGPLGVVAASSDGVVTAANPAFLRLSGLAKESDLVGTQVEDLGAAIRDRSSIRAAMRAAAGADWQAPAHVVIRSQPDEVRATELTVACDDDAAGFLLMFDDVHELQQLREAFFHQGLHDPLTGLPNGAHFRSKVEAVLAEPGAGRVAVLLFDIDGFKVVNDGLGNETADLVLRRVASSLRQGFPDHWTFAARLFGDRFAVVLRAGAGEHPVEPAAIAKVARAVIRELAKPVYVEGVGVGVSASVGVHLVDPPSTDHEGVLRSAEVALHRAKALGKAQCVVFDPRAEEAGRERFRLAAGIAGALEMGEITSVYQPHVVLPDGQIVTSLNAALVWNHPSRGPLRVEELYPLAEMTGMTVPLGRHLLAEAIRTSADWRARHGDQAPMVCLNLPDRMSIDADLVGIVRDELARNELSAQHLMLCIDAASLVDERGNLVDSLKRLAALGVLFIVNVTGLSDVELLATWQIPAPAVMLTGPIVTVLDTDEPPHWARRAVEQLVVRAEELGVKVGAHEVTTQAQADLLHDLGVVVAAGSYQPEYLTRAEAEVWVGRAFAMG